jgi:hypothetical protein
MERKSLGLTKSSINTLMQKELDFPPLKPKLKEWWTITVSTVDVGTKFKIIF